MELLLIIGVVIAVIVWLSNRESSDNHTYTNESGLKVTETLQRRSSRRTSVVEKPEDFKITHETELILGLMENTRQNIFLTGKAGTGKSTLLRYFRSTTSKRHAVVAPTGIAAINVQGQTIHSFFGFKVGVTLDTVRYANAEKLKVLRNLDTLIIDEISMVRADLLDCIDKSLRMNRRNNEVFGGVQIIAIGDPYQLPPIVTESEAKFIRRTYGAPHFFNSKAYKTTGFNTLELSKVYRQSDNAFISILNAIRTGDHNQNHINQLHALTDQNSPSGKSIHLVTTNKMAQVINTQQLSLLDSEPKMYTAEISGKFSEKSAPTEIELVLKEGAKIMLLNNDKEGRWVNGDVGTVIGLGKSTAKIKFEDGTYDDVGPNIWENIQFEYDEDTHKIEPVVIGQFVQLPIKLAWAVTIHKSQGKTYNNVHIDFGSGTFAPGQAYVALSRATSPAGLSFEAPMLLDDVIIDEFVKVFMIGAPVLKSHTEALTKTDFTHKPDSNLPKATLNQMRFFIQNPQGYTSGSKKSRDKVEAVKRTFEANKDELTSEEKAAYAEAMMIYKKNSKH